MCRRRRLDSCVAVALLTTVLLLGAAACGGDDTATPEATEQDAGGGDTGAATADTTAGDDAGQTAAAPASEVPDPCTLLTAADAEALGGADGLTAAAGEPDSFLDQACVWSDASDSEFVRVEIGAVATDVEGFTEAYLGNERGDPVEGVGEGARLDPSFPARIVVVTPGRAFTIEVANPQVDTDELIAVAKKVVAELS